MTAATKLAAGSLHLGEGPIRLDPGTYGCVDIRRGLILDGTMSGELTERAAFDTTVAAIANTLDGGVLVALSASITMLGSPDRAINLPPQDRDIRLNDGKPDPRGRFICGTMADPHCRAPAGSGRSRQAQRKRSWTA